MIDKKTKDYIENQIMMACVFAIGEFEKTSEYIVTEVLEKMLVTRKIMDYCHEHSISVPDKVCSVSYEWEEIDL